MAGLAAAARPGVAMPVDPPLFAAAGRAVRALLPADVPALQALFDANPEYFQAINGRCARPDEAQVEFDETPPSHLPYGRAWKAGVYGDDGGLDGMVAVLSDFCAPGVWHLALFLLATRLHGAGVAASLHDALADWARAQGARWLRLSVIVGHTRAERFWQRLGYVEVRRRHGIDTGGRLNDARVMVLPLGPAGLDAYLAQVPRDRPGSALP
jgi:GNAT superfamily N-acetyltransferase